MPRYAGPIAEFMLTHPDASRFDLLDFLERSWGVRVSTMALHKFLKKYGLDQATRAEATLPGPARIARTPNRTPSKSSRRASPCRCRLPLFLDTDPVCRRVPLDAASLELAGHGRAMFRGRVRLLAAGPVDQHLPWSSAWSGSGIWTRWTTWGSRLCGGRRCPSRYAVGGWRRHLTWYEVDAFCRRTCPWHLLDNDDALVSFDEHTIPRWTKKFHIRKGYVTTRNKYMRCEKLFTVYDLQRPLPERAGHAGQRELARTGGADAGAGVRQGRPAACTPCLMPARASRTRACGPCGTWPSNTPTWM